VGGTGVAVGVLVGGTGVTVGVLVGGNGTEVAVGGGVNVGGCGVEGTGVGDGWVGTVVDVGPTGGFVGEGGLSPGSGVGDAVGVKVGIAAMGVGVKRISTGVILGSSATDAAPASTSTGVDCRSASSCIISEIIWSRSTGASKTKTPGP